VPPKPLQQISTPTTLIGRTGLLFIDAKNSARSANLVDSPLARNLARCCDHFPPPVICSQESNKHQPTIAPLNFADDVLSPVFTASAYIRTDTLGLNGLKWQVIHNASRRLRSATRAAQFMRHTPRKH